MDHSSLPVLHCCNAYGWEGCFGVLSHLTGKLLCSYQATYTSLLSLSAACVSMAVVATAIS